MIRRILLSASVFLLTPICLCVSNSYADVFRIHPSVAVSEEYNDNIFLTDTNKKDEYITRVTPSILLDGETPIGVWNFNYTFDYRYFAKERNRDDITHSLDANGDFEVVKNLLHVKIKDTYQRASLNIIRDYTQESLFLNQTDRNIFIFNPYLVFRLSPRMSLNTGYTFTNIWYKDPSAENKTEPALNAVNKTDHSLNADLSYELSPDMTMTTGYRYTRDDNDVRSYDKNDVYIGGQYKFANDSRLFVTIGNSWMDFEKGRDVSNIYWNAGVERKISFFTASLSTAESYDENPSGEPLRTRSYLAAFKTEEIARTKLNLTFYLKDYNNTAYNLTSTDDIQSRSYGVTGSLRYEIDAQTIGRFAFTADKITDESENKNISTRRYLFNLGLDRNFYGDTVVALDYSYDYVHSSFEEASNYRNNRVILKLSKKF